MWESLFWRLTLQNLTLFFHLLFHTTPNSRPASHLTHLHFSWSIGGYPEFQGRVHASLSAQHHPFLLPVSFSSNGT
ncbi:hypothetical protein F4811DRAFT_536130 [Daldinia bambusicola]|nr:hypothetical protein F4811DRAFT_536130 [Daldinia bambusicola]